MLQPFALVLCQLICYGMHDVQGAPIIVTVTLHRPNPSIEQAKAWNFKSDVSPPDSQFMLESTGIKLSPPITFLGLHTKTQAACDAQQNLSLRHLAGRVIF